MAVIADDRDVAEQALAEYALAPGSALSLLNLSENATYLVQDAGTGERSVLRVHRQGYHRPHEIASELDWLTALRADSDVAVPVVLKARDGRRIVDVEHHGTTRHVVHFALVPGTEPDESNLRTTDFETLGRITAALHEHSRSWGRPAGFGRFAWDWDHSLGTQPRWGRWQHATGVGASERGVLSRAEELLQHRLTAYGADPSRFGLVHADLRPANLLVDGPSITVIDFDDCGFGWFFYDFGTAVSFIEDDPHLGEWQEAWIAGYRSRAPITRADVDMLASFVMMRRLLLLAWMGTHSHSTESQTKAAGFAEGSCALAERYLSSEGRSLL